MLEKYKKKLKTLAGKKEGKNDFQDVTWLGKMEKWMDVAINIWVWCCKCKQIHIWRILRTLAKEIKAIYHYQGNYQL